MGPKKFKNEYCLILLQFIVAFLIAFIVKKGTKA